MKTCAPHRFTSRCTRNVFVGAISLSIWAQRSHPHRPYKLPRGIERKSQGLVVSRRLNITWHANVRQPPWTGYWPAGGNETTAPRRIPCRVRPMRGKRGENPALRCNTAARSTQAMSANFKRNASKPAESLAVSGQSVDRVFGSRIEKISGYPPLRGMAHWPQRIGLRSDQSIFTSQGRINLSYRNRNALWKSVVGKILSS